MSNHLIAPREFPTSLEYSKVRADAESFSGPPSGYHESLLRSYQVLELVKELLDKKVDHQVIRQIIDLNYEE